ncbi:hypothetical protein [Pandoraea bronchicola]|uniref:Uncharacterized protein n=1 Tax=Pandoraea bronchicola TaxID=2508287 RepID=A0A5E5BZL6_9BURK|nr:hypothetical protein [Pandoraea bronchicola]VVE90415.1 hypothetical protein PBR20603_04399 [Pandoraea bronchicola]
MKNVILDCLDKGEWYTRPAIVDLSEGSKRLVVRLIDELVAEGLLVKRSGLRADEFSLAITTPKTDIRSTSNVDATHFASPAPRLSIAGAAYRPKWKRLKAYGVYAFSHQRLCEEVR